MEWVNYDSSDPHIISNVPPMEVPIFNPLDFPPLSRVTNDLPPIHISSSPVEDCSSPLLLGSKVGVMPLETYSNIPEGSNTIVISSIRRPIVSVQKPKKRGKDKTKEYSIAEGEGLDLLCQNSKVSSLFDKGLPRYLGISLVVSDRDLRESTTL